MKARGIVGRARLGQIEAVQVPRGRGPLRVHPFHARHPRPVPRRLLQPFQVRLGAFGYEFHSPVVAVAHPTLQAKAPRPPHQEVPKPDALHTPLHHSLQALRAAPADAPETRTSTGGARGTRGGCRRAPPAGPAPPPAQRTFSRTAVAWRPEWCTKQTENRSSCSPASRWSSRPSSPRSWNRSFFQPARPPRCASFASLLRSRRAFIL